MIQVIAQCDRCNKHLNAGDGWQFQFMPRYQMTAAHAVLGNTLTQELPLYGEICSGCYDMLHFFFRERFREDKKADVQ